MSSAFQCWQRAQVRTMARESISSLLDCTRGGNIEGRMPLYARVFFQVDSSLGRRHGWSYVRLRSPTGMPATRHAVSVRWRFVTLAGGFHLMQRAPPALFQQWFGFHSRVAFVINFFRGDW